MPTNMASKLLKFVYRKCCVDWLRFQNIYRPNRRPFLSLLDLKEKFTRYAGVSTNEADLFDHRARQNNIVYYQTYLHSLASFVEQTQKAKIQIKIWVRMWLPYKLSHLTSSRGARNEAKSRFENRRDSSSSRQWRQWATDTHARVVVSKL